MVDSHKIIIHGELFNESLLVNLLKEYLDQDSKLLEIHKTKDIIVKGYNIYNGALAASALCITKCLIELDDANRK